MATEIDLTGGVLRVKSANGATQTQACTEAIDVSAFDQADPLFMILGVEGAVSAFTAKAQTAMSNESEEGWVDAGATFTSTTPYAPQKINTGGLLRYLRWVVTITGGTSLSLTIQGMARNN